MQIPIGSDHGGFVLKEELKTFLTKLGHEVKDYGINSEISVDYPEYGHAVANHIKLNGGLGVVICGSGIGISIAANKVSGIRASVIRNVEEAIISRQHNNLNVLALGGRTTSVEDAKQIVQTFLNTKFEGGRHETRIKKIEGNK